MKFYPTHRTVCSIEDPAGEVGRVADNPRDVLGQVGVEVGPGGPQAEARIMVVLTWLGLLALLLADVRDVAYSVITGSNQTF